LGDPELDALAAIAAVHTSFAFPDPAVAKRAWERVHAAVSGVAVVRHRDVIDGRHFVTVLGEDHAVGRATILKAKRLLREAGGTETELEPRALLALQNRRRSLALEAAHDPTAPRSRRVRFGGEGAGVDLFGGVHLPRRQG
jgi:hypothetical protein